MPRLITTRAATAQARTECGTRSEFSLSIGLYRDYQQIVDFRMPGVAVLGLDEPRPLGRGWGPSPAHLLASALGACLAGTLLHELRAEGIEILDLRTEVSGSIRSDTLGALHLANLTVRLAPVLARRTDADRMPEPEELADRSMIADSIRTDLGLWIAITPVVPLTANTGAVGAGIAAPSGRAERFDARHLTP